MFLAGCKSFKLSKLTLIWIILVSKQSWVPELVKINYYAQDTRKLKIDKIWLISEVLDNRELCTWLGSRLWNDIDLLRFGLKKVVKMTKNEFYEVTYSIYNSKSKGVVWSRMNDKSMIIYLKINYSQMLSFHKNDLRIYITKEQWSKLSELKPEIRRIS